jgi:hypothetical protein
MLRFMLFSLLVVLCPASALAQKPGSAPTIAKAPDTLTAEARARFEEGVKAAAKRDFEAARVAFKQAYALKPVPEVLRNLGAAEVMSGHDLEGARHLTEYLAGASKLAASERAELAKLVTQAEKKLGRIEISVDAEGAAVSVGGEAVGKSPLGWAWHVAPGEHEVAASKAGVGEAKESLSVAAGGVARIELHLAAASDVPSGPAASAKAPPRPAAGSASGPASDHSSPTGGGGRSIVPAVVGAGVAVMGLGLGVMWKLGSDSDADDADAILARLGPSPCGSGTPHAKECAEVQDKNDSSRAKSDLSTVSFVVGGAALVGTAVYLLWPDSGSSRASIRPRAHIGARGAHIGIEGRFF